LDGQTCGLGVGVFRQEPLLKSRFKFPVRCKAPAGHLQIDFAIAHFVGTLKEFIRIPMSDELKYSGERLQNSRHHLTTVDLSLF
jgi:hypothetical protein